MDATVMDEWTELRLGDDAEPGDWYSRAMTGSRGNVLSNVANALLAIREDARWSGRLKFNAFTGVELLDGQPITDHDITVTQEQLQLAGLRSIGAGPVRDALLSVARERLFHPIRDRLESVSWDGKPRLDTVLAVYFGAEDNIYTRTVGRKSLIAMPARVYKPGCKADYTLILEGKQGSGKSTACRILAGGDEYFSDSLPIEVSTKDAMAHLSGKWIVEMAELSALNKSDAAALKAFLTRDVDKYRPAYGRQEVSRPRQCVFIGTTNHTVYLLDETGGRRFWPVRCGRIDLDGLARDRDQILSEALEALNHGEKWWPDREFERKHAEREQEARYSPDVWADLVAKHVAVQDRVTVQEILSSALGMSAKDMRPDHSRRVVTILQRLSWRPARSNGIRWWVPGGDQQ